MVTERELIALLYRADWTKLTLSGTVTGADPATETTVTVTSDQPPSGLLGHVPPWIFGRAGDAGWHVPRGQDSRPAWGFEPGGEGGVCTLALAPGRRFRADGPDGSWAAGSDGERMWHWFRDRPAGGSGELSGLPQPPYRRLLAPSWLLTGYSLALGGEVTLAGRPGVRVRGALRTVARRTWRGGGRLGRSAGAGGLFAPLPRWLSGPGPWDEEIEAVVDAELGILLRCSRWSAGETPAVTEFLAADVPGEAAAAAFSAPAGSMFTGGSGKSWARGPRDSPTGTALGDAVGEALGTAGKEAAKAVAGLAAAGLGALIRHAPTRPRVDPFAQAAAEAEDPEAEVPADETAPDEPEAGAADDAALADDVLHLVYRSGLAVPSFGATLHQWFDAGALIAAVTQSVRGTGFGGVGLLLDALRDNARESTAGASHAVTTVAMGGWCEYRIDVVRPASGASLVGSRRRDSDQALTIASDGEQQWHVFADRVLTGSASPPPGELADLLDASWLLDPVLVLSGGSELMLGGRRAYRIVARYGEDVWTGFDWWKRLFFPAVAVVDAETGLLLRLTRFKDGRPMMRQELRDVGELAASADFGFTPPDGLPVFGPETPGKEHQPGARAWFWDPRTWTGGWSAEPPPDA